MSMVPHFCNCTAVTRCNIFIHPSPKIQQALNTLMDLMADFDTLKLRNYADKSIVEYLENISSEKNRLNILKKLLTFDSALLDMKMIHSIVTGQAKERIIAVAGGSHIVRMKVLLHDLGYEQVKTLKNGSYREYDLHRCLGSNIMQGSYCVRPQAIDVRLLSQLLE